MLPGPGSEAAYRRSDIATLNGGLVMKGADEFLRFAYNDNYLQ